MKTFFKIIGYGILAFIGLIVLSVIAVQFSDDPEASEAQVLAGQNLEKETAMNRANSYFDDGYFNVAAMEYEDILIKYKGTEEAKEAEVKLAEAKKLHALELEEKAAKKEKALSILRKEYDEMNDASFYYDKSSPESNKSNNMMLYFGHNDKKKEKWLRMRIKYTASDWLFINSYMIKTDNQTYTLSPSYGEVKTDHNGGSIWEWYDFNPSSDNISMIEDIINSETVKIRHTGKQYQKDREVSKKEKEALKNVLTAFELL